MHNAPAVTYPVGRSAIRALISLVLWLAGLAAVMAWSVLGRVQFTLLAGPLVMGAGALAWWGWWQSGNGELCWRTDGWQLRHRQTVSEGAPEVVLDLQASLLLHWCGAQGNTWLWLDRRVAPRQWDALRRAVYSRAIADTPSAGAAIS